MDQKLLERLFLVLLEWSTFGWLLNTGGGQQKQAFGTDKRVTEVKVTVIKAKQILDFDNWLLLKYGVTGRYWFDSVTRFL